MFIFLKFHNFQHQFMAVLWSMVMKYFNKTRTIEQKTTDRDVLFQLKKQTEILGLILQELKKPQN